MNIKLTVGQPNTTKMDALSVGQVKYTNSQKVSFLYLITKQKDAKVGEFILPTKHPYASTSSSNLGLTTLYPDNGLILMNYNDGARISSDIANYRQYGIMTVPRDDYVNAIAIYKKEIWYKQEGTTIVPVEEKNYTLVTNQSDNGIIKDFNIANNRYYKYLYRFVYGGSGENDLSLTEGLKEIIIPIKVKWNGWSLTELHEQEDEIGNIYYTASLKDVWKFKNNVQPGDLSQQTSKTAQETLAKFPRFIHGPKDVISSNITCLLGRDVLPADIRDIDYLYQKEKDKDGKNVWGWKGATYGRYNTGGYKEELWPDVYYADATSNKSVDMLEKWREFCYSGNPKLLKDNKGQKFIVQVHDTSSRTEDNWNGRPITISFSWTQINSADNVVIIEEEE